MESYDNAQGLLMVVKFYRVANRPNLFMGGDRELVMFTGVVAFALIFAMQTLSSAVVGVILWVTAIHFFRMMAKSDTHLRHVYLQDVKYERYYFPYSRPKYVNNNLQRSWYNNPKTILK